MKSNGHGRTYSFAAELAVDCTARGLPKPALVDLMILFRRFTGRRRPRTFYELDPATGEWHLL